MSVIDWFTSDLSPTSHVCTLFPPLAWKVPDAQQEEAESPAFAATSGEVVGMLSGPYVYHVLAYGLFFVLNDQNYGFSHCKRLENRQISIQRLLDTACPQAVPNPRILCIVLRRLAHSSKTFRL